MYRPDLTVVIPTRNERDNVAPLLERFERALRTATRVELVFVDDSTDDTAAVIRTRAAGSPFPVRVVHRAEGERSDGLGGAVLAGIKRAQADWVCVMDADLQHPPELVEPMLQRGRRTDADVVIASRYCDGGDPGGFSHLRLTFSRGATCLARGLFPRRLRGVSDPMSGFFLIRRRVVERSALRPRGFKILLEILTCCREVSVAEVPFRFGMRRAGQSKAGVREGGRYLRALIALRVRTETCGFAAGYPLRCLAVCWRAAMCGAVRFGSWGMVGCALF